MNIKEMLSSSSKNVIKLALDIITKDKGVSEDILEIYKPFINKNYIVYIIDNCYKLLGGGIFAQMQNSGYKYTYDPKSFDLNTLKKAIDEFNRNVTKQ